MINFLLNRPSRRELIQNNLELKEIIKDQREKIARDVINYDKQKAKCSQLEIDLDALKQHHASRVKDFEFLQNQLNETLMQVRATLKEKLALLDRTVQVNYDLNNQFKEMQDNIDALSSGTEQLESENKFYKSELERVVNELNILKETTKQRATKPKVKTPIKKGPKK